MYQQSPDTPSVSEQPLIRPQPPAADREQVARLLRLSSPGSASCPTGSSSTA